MHRDRSRPLEGEQLQNHFHKIRKEKRSGKSFKRRYRSACLKLLSYFIRLFDSLSSHPDYDPYHPSGVVVTRRREQALAQQRECEKGNLPRRNQPLLPRREPADSGYESDDSLVAETVVISEASEGEQEGPFNTPFFNTIYQRLVREGKIKGGRSVPERTIPDLPDRFEGTN